MPHIEDCKIIDIQKISSDRGSLSVLESDLSAPFDIKRVYFTYDIPFGVERGGHSHKNLYQLIISVSGSFNVIIDDGKNRESIFLNNPSKGLLITPGIWRELNNFSSGSVALVAASEIYNEEDYIRDYNEFKLSR